MPLPVYELFAVRYATRDAKRSANFLGGDPHDAPMPMDYFLWVARSPERTIVIDTGFTKPVADRRKRTYLREPIEGLRALGIEPESIRDIVLTHFHYDHAGGHRWFPNARFHVQDDEMRYATGRHMCHKQFNNGYDLDDVTDLIRLVFAGRVQFHKGEAELAPGVSLHRIGGHTGGMQCVRVNTKRGWVVVASDTSHYYEHFETGRSFGTVFNVGETIEGYDTLRRLAASPKHIIPGHDPLVMARYPAMSDALPYIARLDEPPSQ